MPLPVVVQTGAPGDPIRLDAFQTIRGYNFSAGNFLVLEYQSANEASTAHPPPDSPDCVISDCNLPGVTTLSMLGSSFTVVDPFGTGVPPVTQIVTSAMRNAYLAWSYTPLNGSGTRNPPPFETTYNYTNGANVAVFNLDKIKRALAGANFVFKATLASTTTFIDNAWLGSLLAKLYENRRDFRAKADMGLTGIGMDSNPQTPPNFGFPGALLGGQATIPPVTDGRFGQIPHGIETQRICHFTWNFDTNSGTLTLDP